MEFDVEAAETQASSQAPLPPNFRSQRRGSVSAEPYHPPKDTDEPTPPVVHEKTAEARTRIAAAFGDNLLFRNLDRTQLGTIVDAMQEKRVQGGQAVIREGDEGDYFYVVEEGRFVVSKEGAAVVAEIGPGGTFGELALLYNAPRAATVTAETDGSLWAVDRQTFRKIILDYNYHKRQMYEGFLRQVPLLATLDGSEIAKVADALEPVSFSPGQTIMQQGEPGTGFFILEEGEATATIEGRVVRVYGKGDYFGELALIRTAPRAATVTASETEGAKCVSLDAAAFTRLLGPVMDILQRNAAAYEQHRSAQ